MGMRLRRGARVVISKNAIPADAIKTDALVIFANLRDSVIGTYHQVMFDAGEQGVIFKHVKDSEVIYNS